MTWVGFEPTNLPICVLINQFDEFQLSWLLRDQSLFCNIVWYKVTLSNLKWLMVIENHGMVLTTMTSITSSTANQILWICPEKSQPVNINKGVTALSHPFVSVIASKDSRHMSQPCHLYQQPSVILNWKESLYIRICLRKGKLI